MMPSKANMVKAFVSFAYDRLKYLVELHELKLSKAEKRELYTLAVQRIGYKFANFKSLDLFKPFAKCVVINVINNLALEFKFRSERDQYTFTSFAEKITTYMDSEEYIFKFKGLSSF